VKQTNNGDRKMLPLTPAVIDELRRHEGAPSGLIFASRRRPDRAFNIDPAWERALSAAGRRNFRFHDLRHSCASYLAQDDATLLEIAEVLGHWRLSVTKRYSTWPPGTRRSSSTACWGRSSNRHTVYPRAETARRPVCLYA
jgi:integrase